MSDRNELKRAVGRIGSALLLVLLFASVGYANGFSDPMRPTAYTPQGRNVAETEADPQWSLTSILISPERRTAVINGHTLTPGEKLGAATVVAISQGMVILRHEGKKVTLSLSSVAIKRPAIQ